MCKEDLVQELNHLLRKNKLNLPDFRREVTVTGKNVEWLQKNIKKRNSGYDDRINVLIEELAAS